MKKGIICILMLMLASCGEGNSSSFPTSSSSFESESSTVIIDTSSSEDETPVSKKYRNAVFDSNLPDPSIVKSVEDGYYYIFGTRDRPIRSLDLVNWELAPDVIFPVKPKWGTSGANVWAPDVKRIQGQYVMYYSLSVWDDVNPGIGIATASSLAGPWTDLGKLFLSDEIGVNNSIDPMAYIEEDGSVYLIWGSFRGNYVIRLTDDGLGFYDGSVQAARENKIRIAGKDTASAFDGSTFEGAYIVKKDGKYWFFGSSGACCGTPFSYTLKVGVSDSLFGPYLDAQGRDLKTPDTGSYVVKGNAQWEATGHNSVIMDDDGNYWTFYHGYHKDDHSKGRVLLMDKLLWDNGSQGFPHVFADVPSNNLKDGPSLFANN
jgi:arabinan endo-1,5-alpha-L-arabinosidase